MTAATAQGPVVQENPNKDVEKADAETAIQSAPNAPLAHEPTPWYLRVPFAPTHAPPPPKTLDDASITPEVTANLYDTLTLGWILPILALGYARPLQTTDLWKIDEARSAKEFSQKIDDGFARRVVEANEYNQRLERGEIKPPWTKKFRWYLTSRGEEQRKEKEQQWREKDGRKRPSLLMALHDSVKRWYWAGMTFRLLGDTAQITSPLIIKEIIRFSGEMYAYYKGYSTASGPPNIGRGIALAIGLLLLTMFSSLCNAQSLYRLMSTGAYLRTGLISSIFKQSLKLSNKSRSHISNGKLIAHISADVSRIDFAAGFSMGFTAPVQLLICLALLIVNLGYSALPGFGIFFIVIPLQTRLMKASFSKRKNSMRFTDQRSKLLQEVLSGIRIIKYFAWEIPFLNRISDLRYKELRFIRTLLFLKSATLALAFSLPVFASAISFITYSLTGHPLDPAIIFTALSYFDLMRVPLLLLPASLNAATDAANAIGRLRELYEAEILTETKSIDENLDVAIRVQDAHFTWDAPPPIEEKSNSKKKGGKDQSQAAKAAKDKSKEEGNGSKENVTVFQLKDINLEIPRGKLVSSHLPYHWILS
ncbi:hypothetical protein FRC03_007064 [Tulasnella sp. 419]|nr:hypothetical protein FRC03_007064 [Tulasnella sp. 419]